MVSSFEEEGSHKQPSDNYADHNQESSGYQWDGQRVTCASRTTTHRGIRVWSVPGAGPLNHIGQWC